MLTIDFSRLGLLPRHFVLDIGCGYGRHSWEAFSKQGVSVVAADIRVNVLRGANFMLEGMKAQGIDGGGAAHVLCADAACLPFADCSFDCVLCSELLEHLPDDAAAISELARVARCGGRVVVSVPGYFPERLCWGLSSHYPEMADGHVRIYKKGPLLGLLAEKGLSCYAVRRVHALHSPLWWLKCLAREKKSLEGVAKLWEAFVYSEISGQMPLARFLERLMDPLLGKSLVMYCVKKS